MVEITVGYGKYIRFTITLFDSFGEVILIKIRYFAIRYFEWSTKKSNDGDGVNCLDLAPFFRLNHHGSSP